MNKLFKITIIIPTYNSEARIEKCLDLIKKNDYPAEKTELIIVDGGSTDKTLEIVKKYDCIILHNSKRLAEPGKALGIKKATGELLCFIDDDNFIEDKNFFRKMIIPFNDKQISAAEPWEFTKMEGLKPLERYWVMMGLNDPVMYFIGCYEKLNKISNKWTNLYMPQEDKKEYLKIKLAYNNLPTLGSNGFIVRTECIRKTDYNNLLDIDRVADMVRQGNNIFAKVKCSIGHTFAGNLINYWSKAIRKAGSFNSTRLFQYPNLKFGITKFIISTLLIFPIVFQATNLFIKTNDITASFCHLPICYFTLFAYGYKYLNKKIF